MWIFLEVVSEIVDPRISQRAQYLPAAGVIQFEERHRHRLENVLIARLTLLERSLGFLGQRYVRAGAAITPEFSICVEHRLSARLHVHRGRAVGAGREIDEVAKWFA